jgi:hypothetical protein
MENSRTNHPKPISNKAIGVLTFKEVYLSMMNTTFEVDNEPYRIMGYSVFNADKNYQKIVLKSNRTMKEHTYQVPYKKSDTIREIMMNLILQIN